MLFKKSTKILFVLMIVFFVFVSYFKSKLNAEEFVGDIIEYFPLTETEIVVNQFRNNKIVWCFKFTFPYAFDEEFFVYTTLWGDILGSNPRDLKEKLREMEKSDGFKWWHQVPDT